MCGALMSLVSLSLSFPFSLSHTLQLLFFSFESVVLESVRYRKNLVRVASFCYCWAAFSCTDPGGWNQSSLAGFVVSVSRLTDFFVS